ncbi:restriction endonuclease subunit S [Proteus terrae]|uniref:restriction endonuclease subunit S n=1 Tax=Proteus terrae TaxID=1574161 RepID=UPI001BA760B9|nr:restriction endonuclease subunit S [Proteus terrae]
MSNGVVETGLNLIPAGYKQTEVGVIPEDWECSNFDYICSTIGDGIHSTPTYNDNGEYFFINGNNLIDGKITMFNETKKTDFVEFYKHKKNLNERTILLSINGTIGNIAFYRDEQIVLGKSAAYLNIKSTIDKYYIYYCLCSEKTLQTFYDGLTGSTIKNLGLGTIRTTNIPLPPKKEQNAIAKALSDVDALISELENLIAKKQAIKNATMQQLLTGRTRLPQFELRKDGSKKSTKQSELGEIPEDWEVKMVFELADCQKSLFDDGDWIEAEHITNKGIRLIQTGNIGVGRYVDKDTKKYIFKESFEKLKCKELHEGDLLICRLAEPAGRACIFPYIGEDKVITSVDVTIFRPSHKVTSREFYNQYFSSSDWFKSVLEQVGGTTHKRISRGALGRISVRYPNIEEQTAIATILSDMDKDIQTLEQRLSKTRQIKQGMMQELLTGKTRLVND